MGAKDRDASIAPHFFLRAILLALPALLAGYLIFLRGVDTPWGDQWDGTAQLFEKMQAGTLRLSDFFAFHNEHRIFFPRLLDFALIRLTHWNTRVEMLVIWLLLCVCALNIWRLAKATGWRDPRRLFWLLLASNFLLFTPLQWENLIWGFQIGFLLPLAATTSALCLATSARRPLDFVFTMILCLVATFSVASGFTSWILVAPVLIFAKEKMPERDRLVWWSIWILTACASIYFYFHGFAQPRGHPSESYSSSHPLEALQFFLTYLGSPFSWGTAMKNSDVAQIVGATLLVSLALSLAYLWHWRREKTLIARAVAWVSLSGIALANAFLTTIGRAGFGISAAQPPRYVSFAIMLPLVLPYLAAIILHDAQKRGLFQKRIHLVRTSCVAYASALGLLLLLASISCLSYWSGFQHKRLLGKSALLLSEVLDESEGLQRYVHWAGVSLRPRINLLDRLGYLHPPLLRSRQMSALAADAKGEKFGELTNFAHKENGDLAAGGWAILPTHHRVADSVLLAYENEAGEWILFARADVGASLPAVSQALDDDAFEYSGWIRSWKASELPPEARRISAWAFDANFCRAFLIGTISI